MYLKGAGPTVIVVPGVQGRWEWVRPALDRLAERCRVCSYSLCGDIGSGWRRDARLGFDNYMHQLDDVVRRLGVDRVSICGISYGGFIALRYAATRAERVDALAFVSSPAPGWAPSEQQRRYLAHPWLAAPAFVLGSPFRMWPEIAAAFDSPPQRLRFGIEYGLRALTAPMIPGLMAARIVEQQSIDFTPDIRGVRAPTLVISGEPHLDRVVPVESTRRWLDMIPGAKYVMIERTGHLGLVTRPRVFAAALTDFVHAHADCR